ncbi:hypothetical protein FOB58_004241 [Candida parapsilosis]|uniref:Uncharacterized protein n=2 Tax=Candida parapsilosis TaxID=5480 RepID=G8BJK9_CANPC|nr:uncharacterized protein CPAR2_406280 [Candida parapsilosis]KAF6045804.1 hypothetical protein FOB58_004241 [Candida parapsilosis]KAF6046643.1 hypothetical protein FOB59_004108 [Candida parapsilosis]KAF6050916.1 hypothetical protein FOB60_003584 [Candida parapsilosis]KAF6062362.1 hypothetical protein FOB61_003792 [Candida parapsilosis]KAI5903311.1 hypothetical protein K4G60_g2466 [Candida parapsilosis]
MFSRLSKRITTQRFQHSTTSTTKQATHSTPFNNKYHFNLNPPPVHEYWNVYNSSVLFAFVPVFLGIAYAAKYIGVNIEGNAGLLQYANGENSPLKSIKFGEPQLARVSKD